MRFKPGALSPNAWAVNAGVSRTVWADMRRHGNPSRRTLEKLLAAAGSSLAEFEALRVGPEPAIGAAGLDQVADRRPSWRQAPLQPLPLIGSKLAGEWGEPGSQVELTEIRFGEVIGQLPRPLSLASDPDAYALTIVGDSMWPRFRPGTLVAVSPRSPVTIGDDVLVRLRSPEGRDDDLARALIKRLVKRTATTFELRQFNPDLTVAVDSREVETIVRVAGELI